MYASITTYNLKPGKRDAAVAFSKSADWAELIAQLKQSYGLKQNYHLLELGADKAVAISVYTTEAEVMAAGDAPSVKATFAKLADVMDLGSIARTVYEVISEDS
jgi:hypothetical protein